jgi:ABC-2 type transport system permease protein
VNDIITVIRKELKEAPYGVGQGDRRNGIVVAVVFFLLFGVIHPMNVRGALFEGLSLILLAVSGAFFTASGAPDAYAGERERRTLETLLTTRLGDVSIALGKIAACALVGWGASIALVASATVTVAVTERSWSVIPLARVAFVVVLALLVNILVAAAGIIASALSQTTRQALQVFTVVLMIIISGPVIAMRLNAPFKKRILATLASSSSQLAPLSVAMLVAFDVLLIGVALLICRRRSLLPDNPA